MKDFAALAAELLRHAHDLLPSWLPGGRVTGHEYECGNLRGGPGDSCKVNLQTGKWADFASTDKGGDLISLYAAIEGIRQGAAAKRLSEQIGHTQTEVVASPPVKPQLLLPAPNDVVPSMVHAKHGKPTGVWTYRNEQGEVLFYVARYDTPKGKQFAPWSWAAAGHWVSRGWPVPRPLYKLDELAQRPDAPVIVVEGEKAADAASKIAGSTYAVTTWPNGALAVKRADWRPLTKRHVLIWPDADDPGRRAAAEVAQILLPLARSLKVLDPEGQPEGWDAADAVSEGWDWVRLLDWAKPRARLIQTPTVALAIAQGGPGQAAVAAVQVNVDHPDAVPTPSRSLYALWEEIGIATSKSGQPICNGDNVLRILEGYNPMAGMVWFDEFHQRLCTLEAGRPREWTDADMIRLTLRLQRELGLSRLHKDVVSDAVSDFARAHPRNELRDWIEGLAWDGTPRIATCFQTYFGAKPGEHIEAASRNFWIGLAARIYRPGCLLHHMVVLEGAQGIGKTMALRVIGGPWYTEAHESVTSKDFFLMLQGKLVVEIAELDSFSRVEVTRIKQVVSCPSDRYRAPYGRHTQDYPRRCVFVGTTNEVAYLRDPTGARRFWPVKCGAIDIVSLKADRDQLFAEAASCFKGGALWYEMPAETKDVQEERRQTDEWESEIQDYLMTHAEITIREIAEDCLKIEIAKLDRPIQLRIGRILHLLGFEKRTFRQGERVFKTWVRVEEAPPFA